jgi:hypothetical protein
MAQLTATGRATRIIATVVGVALLLGGTLWGQDDKFPFGPFSMYAGVNGPNEPAPDTRVEGTDRTGRVIVLNERNAGVRRAEIEGQEGAYVADPQRLARIADGYQGLNPAAPPLVKVALIVRQHEIRHSTSTGRWHDDVRAVWERPA